MEWVTTSTVLLRLGEFENDAWDCFALRFRQPIVNFARSMGLSDADSEDVAQETLLAFAEQFRNGQYDQTKGRLSKWLFGIAHRQALSERRAGAKRAARGHAPGAEDSFWSGVPDERFVSQTWDQEWERALLDQCIKQVQREVDPLTLRAFELIVRVEKTPAQAANILQTSIKQVYNAKHRVLKRIRELRLEIEEIS